jgi:hypothetical protein
VVGAGIAGVACARALLAGGHAVQVLERSPVPGGRMASRELHGRRVDTGASYFTVSDDGFRAVVDDWAGRGLARPWTDTFATYGPAGRGADTHGPWRWAAPGGLRALVTDLAAGLDVRHGEQVAGVGEDGAATVDGRPYDVVVLAMPDPQALRLLAADGPAAALLAGRAWEPALALAAGFDARGWAFDGAFVNDPVLSWVADDGSRRGDGAPVLVAHSTGEFAASRLADPDAAVPALVAALRRVLDLPEPAWARVQRWMYAKPVGTREPAYGLAGAIGLCGDGWGASKVQAAWQSGHALGQALA